MNLPTEIVWCPTKWWSVMDFGVDRNMSKAVYQIDKWHNPMNLCQLHYSKTTWAWFLFKFGIRREKVHQLFSFSNPSSKPKKGFTYGEPRDISCPTSPRSFDPRIAYPAYRPPPPMCRIQRERGWQVDTKDFANGWVFLLQVSRENLFLSRL